MLKNILFTCLVIFYSTTLGAEGHQKNPVDTHFKTAVKHIEKKRFFEAFEIFSTLADRGIPEAHFNLALLYSNGLGVPKNYRLAFYWSWQAHLNDHESAINSVKTIYDLIDEKLRNSVAQTIIDEMLLIAQSGDRAAPLKLGKTYLKQKGFQPRLFLRMVY